jgi:hypothetical protein
MNIPYLVQRMHVGTVYSSMGYIFPFSCKLRCGVCDCSSSSSSGEVTVYLARIASADWCTLGQ